jgi:hypothetical protein
MADRHAVVPLALAGCAVGALVVFEHERRPASDPVGTVAVVGLGVGSVLVGGLALGRMAGRTGRLLGVGLGLAITTSWSRHDAHERNAPPSSHPGAVRRAPGGPA